MTDQPAAAPATRPTAVVVLCALLLVEVAALAVAAVASVVFLVRGSELPGPLAFMAVMAALVAVVLVAAARSLWRGGARWARSPVMFWQILLIVLALGWMGVEASGWTVLVLLLAAGSAVALLLKPVVAWTLPATS
ncbi:hypothetical protein [Cellulomonas denverensis]|uniref:hypothetical protein n=1 Tax=Cellulomonas denverensis TaxID=264297 RepID=UPI001A408495|nr:hypothetical protein [Cellulomonas denverensis]GIG25963.1 hypothetical protein Cde04nite_22070 [Cellulomonas denverensis]